MGMLCTHVNSLLASPDLSIAEWLQGQVLGFVYTGILTDLAVAK